MDEIDPFFLFPPRDFRRRGADQGEGPTSDCLSHQFYTALVEVLTDIALLNVNHHSIAST